MWAQVIRATFNRKQWRRSTSLMSALGVGMGYYCWSSEVGLLEEEAKTDKWDWDAQVDFVVVGAGSAGCALATRLSQAYPMGKTLLIEAGDTDNLPEIQTAVDYFGKAEKIFGSDRDWAYHAEGQTELHGRAIYQPRGKVLGGCSSFNTMVYLRGDPYDYDNWAKLVGNNEWNWKNLLPFFKRIETHPGDEAIHGKSGPITVAPLNHDSHAPGGAAHFVTRVFCQAAQCLGIPFNPDFARQTYGVGFNDVNACNGKRCNAAAYLKMAGVYPATKGVLSTSTEKDELTLWLCSRVQRIIFDENKRVIGLEVKLDHPFDFELQPGQLSCRSLEHRRIDGPIARIKVNGEIILSAGAIDSPRLLLLSGVGPKEHLKKVGVKVVHDLPGVGHGFKDHMHVPMCYRIPQGVKPHSHSNICEGSLFTKLNPESPSPDLQVHIGTLFFEPDGFSPLGEGFTLTPSLIKVKSTGYVELASSDPEDRPVVVANYLTDPRDLKQLVDGVKFVRTLGAKMLALIGGGEEVYPGNKVESDEEIETYIRKFVGSMYHPCRTCRMGKDDDPMAVLDAKLRVRGVQNLRVADASSFPETIGANTNATSICMGEKGAQIVIDDWLGNLRKVVMKTVL